MGMHPLAGVGPGFNTLEQLFLGLPAKNNMNANKNRPCSLVVTIPNYACAGPWGIRAGQDVGGKSGLGNPLTGMGELLGPKRVPRPLIAGLTSFVMKWYPQRGRFSKFKPV